MVETTQIIPLHRRPASELLQAWEQELAEHSFTVQQFRRRLDRSDPDRRARFQYAIRLGQEHMQALAHRIARAKGLHGPQPSPILLEEEPELRSQWQSRR